MVLDRRNLRKVRIDPELRGAPVTVESADESYAFGFGDIRALPRAKAHIA